MQTLAILRAVLPAFGEYLYRLPLVSKIDMDLAVLAIDLLFATDLLRPHQIYAALDAAAFEPGLPSDLGP